MAVQYSSLFSDVPEALIRRVDEGAEHRLARHEVLVYDILAPVAQHFEHVPDFVGRPADVVGVVLRADAGEVDGVGAPVHDPARLDQHHPSLPPVIAPERVEPHELDGVLGQVVVVLLLLAVLQVHQEQARQQETTDAPRVGVSQPADAQRALEQKCQILELRVEGGNFLHVLDLRQSVLLVHGNVHMNVIEVELDQGYLRFADVLYVGEDAGVGLGCDEPMNSVVGLGHIVAAMGQHGHVDVPVRQVELSREGAERQNLDARQHLLDFGLQAENIRSGTKKTWPCGARGTSQRA